MEKSAILQIELEGDEINFDAFAANHPEVEITTKAKDIRHCQISISQSNQNDIRQEISRFISGKGWLILEMHQNVQSMEEIFHELTGEIPLDQTNPKEKK
ncbi:MAG: hypothetical protein PHO32_09925, partial [Candidatus Cloacimonetes bacterium]|nr:hypothetical protein [Candidatus Cloacimonadota bacterium]